MPVSTPRGFLDLEDLGLHEGAAVLLRRALVQVAEEDWLEVRGGAADLEESLPAWCRKEGLGYRYVARGLRRIQKAAHPPLVKTLRGEPAEVAEPAWGLAPRGGRLESGGPPFGFTL